MLVLNNSVERYVKDSSWTTIYRFELRSCILNANVLVQSQNGEWKKKKPSTILRLKRKQQIEFRCLKPPNCTIEQVKR